MKLRATLRLVLSLALPLALSGPAPAEDLVIPGGVENEVAKVAAPYVLGGEVAEGFRLNGMRINGSRIELVLERKVDTDGVTLALTPRDRSGAYDLSAEPPEERQSAAARRAAAVLKEAVVRNADVAFWRRILRAPDDPVVTQQRNVAPSAWEQVSLWMALAAGLVALVTTVMRGARWPAVECVAVLAWSVFVRFALTEPNILTDGGSGYRRLLEYVPGYGGLSALIRTVLPSGPHFMWTALRIPWALSALAPPMLVLLARALGFSRGTALFAGVALASLPLHAAMYASDFELGALVTLQLLGLALVAAAVRSQRAELAAAGAGVLAYTCWGRPDAPLVGAVLLVIALPALVRARPVMIAALAWFGLNAAASLANVRASGGATSIFQHLQAGVWQTFPVAQILLLQAIVPFWCWLPLPLGIARLAWRDRRRLAVVGVGIAAGFAPVYLRGGMLDPSQSFMEFFRYGTWALPWILLATAEGMEAAALWVGSRFGGAGAERVARLAIVAVCAATPLVLHDYLSRRYGPRAEEEVFRAALAQVPGDCAVVVPDDDSEGDGQRGGTIEIRQRYVYIGAEVAAVSQSPSTPRIVGVTSFLKAIGAGSELPPTDSAGAPCWYYFRGSYCYTGVDGHAPTSCTELERRAVLQPVLTRDILYISHRLITRPDLRHPPFYDPAQRLELSRIVGLRAVVAE